MEQWIIEELERTELGDKRRTKRLYWKRVTTRLLPRQKSLYINTLSDFRGKAATRF